MPNTANGIQASLSCTNMFRDRGWKLRFFLLVLSIGVIWNSVRIVFFLLNGSTPDSVADATKLAAFRNSTGDDSNRNNIPTGSPDILGCCYRTDDDFSQLFNEKYFAAQDAQHSNMWNGNGYQAWLDFAATPYGQVVVAQPPGVGEAEDCRLQWNRVVLKVSQGSYLKHMMDVLPNAGFSSSFPFIEDQPNIPRILLLGDSISQGISALSQVLFPNSANIHASPTTIWGIDTWIERLDEFLGRCPWDLIQFNLGQHFHPTDDEPIARFEPYRIVLKEIMDRLRAHSPSAKIIFALTTPTPFDTHETFPEEASCPFYHLFHPEGFVSAMNEVAKEVASESDVIVNDRYSAVIGNLSNYQNPCDIHFTNEGYGTLAESDWKIFERELGLPTTNRETSRK